MFIVEDGHARAARKTAVLVAVLLLLALPGGAAVLFALFTLHFPVRPSPPIPPGFRFCGFPRPRTPLNLGE